MSHVFTKVRNTVPLERRMGRAPDFYQDYVPPKGEKLFILTFPCKTLYSFNYGTNALPQDLPTLAPQSESFLKESPMTRIRVNYDPLLIAFPQPNDSRNASGETEVLLLNNLLNDCACSNPSS